MTCSNISFAKRQGMFIVANFLIATAKILNLGLTIYMWIVIARAIISWVNPDPYNTIVRFLYATTEPVLYSIRRRLPTNLGGFDFSPIIVIVAIIFLQTFVVGSLLQFAAHLGPR
jgi:YggT family protein